MRNWEDLRKKFDSELENEYSKTELDSMFNLLIKSYLRIPFDSGEGEKVVLNEIQRRKFSEAVQRLKQHEPIQYILGEVTLFGRRFKVNSSVHVPRPETETMVEWVKQDFPELLKRTGSTPELLDIGTGCGVLPITLSKELELKAAALDLSEKALEVARENSRINNADVEFIQGDVLRWEKLPKQFDIIVSNPPYVLERSRKDVQRKILDHEPSVALYVKDEDPMIFNRKIAELAQKNLSPEGLVYVEINKFLGAETANTFHAKGFKTEIRKDIFGSERTIKAFRH